MQPKTLTGKQKRFCEEYALDYNGTRAAIVAGYSKRTATVIASENLKKPLVLEYINSISPIVFSKIKALQDSKNKNDNGFVYLIHCETTSFYKIGKTKRNIKYRLGNLQSLSPFKLSIVDYVQVLDSSKVEKELHSLYLDSNVRGEWFEFKKEKVKEVVRKMKEYEKR